MANFLTESDPNPVTYAVSNARVLIAQVLESKPNAIVDAGINLLRAMARTSRTSMTETEFYSLLAHAAHREKVDCPGWHPMSHENGGEQEFALLHRCLSDYTVAHGNAVIHGLLNVLAGKMALLIGEHLTFLEFRRALASVSTTDRPAKAEEAPGALLL